MPASRRQTLAAGRLPPSKPPGGGAGSVSSSSTRRRVPKSNTTSSAGANGRRKSMLPRVAGADRENVPNSRRQSGIAAPSPSRSRSKSASRKSLGGAILQSGHGASTPAKNRRVSLAPAGHASAGGSGHDPRDVKDKSYLTSAVRKVVSYLKSRGYPDAPALNVRQLLNGPSGRDFRDIMTFLLRRVDAGFNRPPPPGKQRSDELVVKFEDEVSMAFRCLGYPFPISKTGLVAVGSPHTWPALIAAIDWLVDVLTIRDGEDELEWGPDAAELQSETETAVTLAGSAARVDRQFHKFLRRSMVAFLRDDNDECGELEGALLDEFQRDSEGVEAHISGLDDECGRMKEEIARLNQENSGLSEVQGKQEENAAGIEKMLGVIQQLTDHREDLTAKVEALIEEKESMESEAESIERRIAQLKETIGSQELSKEDVRRMEREKARVEEQAAKQAASLEEKKAGLAEAKEQWERVYEILEATVDRYNARARDLELVPKRAKHAKGHDFEVRLHKGRAAEGVAPLLGGVDVGGAVKPHVKALAAGYEGETASAREQTADMEERVGAAEGEGERLAEEIGAIEDKITSCNEERAASTEDLEADIRDKRRQLDLLNSKIASLNDPKGVESSVAKYDAERAQLQKQLKRQEKESAATKKAVNDEIRRALELAREHRAHEAARLREMNEHVERRKEECYRVRLLES